MDEINETNEAEEEVISADGPRQAGQEIEKKAREWGWVPEGEWKGDPPKGGFVDAETFVRRGEEVLPFIRKQNRALEEKNAKLMDELDAIRRESSDRFARLEKMSKAALQQQRERLSSEFAAKKEAAVDIGDREAYRAIDREEREVLKAFDERMSEKKENDEKEDRKKAELPASIRSTIDEWVGENQWFLSDPELNGVANVYHERLLKEKPGLSLADNLAAVRAYVERRYPDKFGKEESDTDTRPNGRASRVEGGSRIDGAGGRSLYAKLPADAKIQADRFIKDDGLFLERGETAEKDLARARERYAAQFFGE